MRHLFAKHTSARSWCAAFAVLALALVLQFSQAGCSLRCLDALSVGAAELVLTDGAVSCIEKQGSSEGLPFIPLLSLLHRLSSFSSLLAYQRLHPPRAYLEPPLRPPEPSNRPSA